MLSCLYRSRWLAPFGPIPCALPGKDEAFDQHSLSSKGVSIATLHPRGRLYRKCMGPNTGLTRYVGIDRSWMACGRLRDE